MVSDFTEASRNFILDFLHKKTAKNCETIRSHSRKTVLICRTLKKCSSCDTPFEEPSHRLPNGEFGLSKTENSQSDIL